MRKVRSGHYSRGAGGQDTVCTGNKVIQDSGWLKMQAGGSYQRWGESSTEGMRLWRALNEWKGAYIYFVKVGSHWKTFFSFLLENDDSCRKWRSHKHLQPRHIETTTITIFMYYINTYACVRDYGFHVLLILLTFMKHLLDTRHCAKYTTCILSLCHLMLTKLLRGSSHSNPILKRKT